MRSSTAAAAVLFTVLGVAAGWNFRRAQAAHGDVKLYKGRLPGFRKIRLRSGLAAVVLFTLIVLALHDLIH